MAGIEKSDGVFDEISSPFAATVLLTSIAISLKRIADVLEAQDHSALSNAIATSIYEGLRTNWHK